MSSPSEKVASSTRRSTLSSLRSGPERADLLNDTRWEWARRPSRRRALCAGYVANVVLLCTAVALMDAPAGGLAPVIAVGFVVSFLVMLFLIASLNAATRGVIDLRSRHIDERQRHRRGQAYETAYRIGFAVVVLGLVAAVVGEGRWVPLAGAGFVFLLLLMLPTLVAAWTDDEE